MARSWAAVVSWAIGTAVVVTGLVVTVCQVPPDNLVSAQAYNRVFSVHADVSLAAMCLLVVPMGEREWLEAPGLRGAALGLVIAGALVLGVADVFGGDLGPRAQFLAVPVGALVQSVGALVFAVAIVRHGNETRAARFCRAAVLVWFAAWLGIRTSVPILLDELNGPANVFVSDPESILILLDRAAPTLSIIIALGVTAALALSSARDVGMVSTLAIACAFGLLASALVHSAAALLALLAGLAFGVRAFTAGRNAPSRWQRWTRRAQAVVFIEVLLLRALLLILNPEIHLHDTLFSVAAMHMAFFAAALGWVDASNPKEERSGAIGLGAILAGGHGVVLAHLVLGSQGNPRRYAAYLDHIEGWPLLHGLAALAGAILVVGCVTVALATKDRERPGTF